MPSVRSDPCRCAPSGLSRNSSVGLETSASAEVKSILSNTCVVENTDVKVICSITTRILKEFI